MAETKKPPSGWPNALGFCGRLGRFFVADFVAPALLPVMKAEWGSGTDQWLISLLCNFGNSGDVGNFNLPDQCHPCVSVVRFSFSDDRRRCEGYLTPVCELHALGKGESSRLPTAKS